MIENVQRGNQLAAEEAGSPAFPPERRQRLDHMEVAHAGAKTRFKSPDADDHARIDRKSVAHASEQRAVLLECGATVGDALVVDQQRAILRPGHGEFGLMPIALQHLLVRLHPSKCTLQRRGRYARASRLGAKAGEETLEAIRRGNGGRGKDGGNRSSQ